MKHKDPVNLVEQGKGGFSMADETVDTIIEKFGVSLLNKKLAKRAIPDTAFYAIDSAHIQTKVSMNRPDPLLDNAIIK